MAPSESKVAEKIKEIIVDHLGIDEAEVTPNAHFIDDLGGDSLDVVELIMAVEEEYGIDIPDETIDKLGTVREIVEYVEGKVKEK